jgi:hypothetical protein
MVALSRAACVQADVAQAMHIHAARRRNAVRYRQEGLYGHRQCEQECRKPPAGHNGKPESELRRNLRSLIQAKTRLLGKQPRGWGLKLRQDAARLIGACGAFLEFKAHPTLEDARVAGIN